MGGWIRVGVGVGVGGGWEGGFGGLVFGGEGFRRLG